MTKKIFNLKDNHQIIFKQIVNYYQILNNKTQKIDSKIKRMKLRKNKKKRQ